MYDCAILLKPNIKMPDDVMDLISHVGKHIYQTNGVLTELKSLGIVHLGYGIEKLNGRHYQGRLLQMTKIAPSSVNKELHYLNKKNMLLLWFMIATILTFTDPVPSTKTVDSFKFPHYNSGKADVSAKSKLSDKVFRLTYVVAYALTNSHHIIDYKKNEYIKLDDIFSEIEFVEEKQFSDISPLDNSWAIDFSKNKPILGQKPKMSFRGRTLEVGESSNTSNKELLHSMSRRVDDLCQKLD
ncbi:hypothetical protein AgCh_011031 [Apium graveolens]